jgi:hypothetical protein
MSFSTYVYLLHSKGHSVEDLAIKFGIQEDRIEQRIEAARLCFERQVPQLLEEDLRKLGQEPCRSGSRSSSREHSRSTSVQRGLTWSSI